MHSIAEVGTNVPAFLGKLWKMVEDPVTNDLIVWSLTGTSFIIKEEIRFARELLPMYYKHNNMASFVRQLNMYGFHKIVSPDAGSMKMEGSEEIQFTHPCFVRGHPYMLDNIKRKIGVNKLAVAGTLEGERPPQVMGKVLTDMRQMKGRQESMDGRLTAMKLENAALWRELSVLRQKHIKQQQIVNKLIQFLVTVVQQNQSSFSVKRKMYPKMLQHRRSGEHHLDIQEHASSSATSPMGPVIHELDPAEALLEDVVEEAEAITPIMETSPEPHYFLHQPSEEDVEPLVFQVNSPYRYSLNQNASDETIIGMPEDTLIINVNKKEEQNQSNHVLKKTSRPTIVTNTASGGQSRKRKILRIAPKRLIKSESKQPRQIIVQRPVQQPVTQAQPMFVINQNDLIKKQETKRNRKNTNRSQPKPILNIQEQNEEIAAVNSSSSLLTVDSGYLPVQAQPTSAPVPVITVPCASGACENILPEPSGSMVDPSILPGGSAFNLPLEVDSAATSTIASPDPLLTPVAPSPPFTATPPSKLQLACVDDSQSPRSPALVTRSEMDNHLDSVQSDLESLKELLRSEGISLDANALLGCFNEDPLSYNIMSNPNNEDDKMLKENNGNELMAYSPSLFDLTDLMGNDWNLPSPGDQQPPADDMFAEVNTPQFVQQTPSFPTPTKKRRT